MRYPELTEKLDAIEAELRRLDLLVGSAKEAEAVSSAFGYREMSFERWLGHVFLPNARNAVASDSIPSRSQVGIAAARNFDGDDRLQELVSLLCDFDQTVEGFSASAERQKESHKPTNSLLDFFWKFFKEALKNSPT
jgi:uncharacterized protein YqcC (DUF446 family)